MIIDDGSLKNMSHEELLERYEELKKSRDRVFLIASHDLRSPFSGLLGLTGMLAEDLSRIKAEDLQDFLNTINDTLKQTFRMIDNLAEWGRIERGRYEKTIEQIPLKYGLNDILPELEADAELKQIELVHDYPPDVILRANNKMFDFVLKSFISNAIKYSKRGSRVVIGYSGQGDRSAVYVQDFGTGIDMHRIEKLFEIDSQWRMNGTAGETGTGLSLLASSRFAEYFGASIEVESSPGKGSTFSLILQEPRV